MSNSESMEMYLETIYLIEKAQGHAHVVDIAKQLNVSKASVSKAAKNLKKSNYIKKEAYGSITLTNKGRALSEKIYYNHNMITAYLKDSLGISNKEASENACKMEHVITEEMIKAIKDYLEKNSIEVKLWLKGKCKWTVPH